MKMVFRHFGEKTRKSNNLLLDNAIKYLFFFFFASVHGCYNKMKNQSNKCAPSLRCLLCVEEDSEMKIEDTVFPRE